MKDIKNWGNPNLLRMVVEDQKELFRDVKNINLILPSEQQELWRLEQLYCTLICNLQEEMILSQQWQVYDMRHTAAELTQFMKTAVNEEGSIWSDYDKKINY